MLLSVQSIEHVTENVAIPFVCNSGSYKKNTVLQHTTLKLLFGKLLEDASLWLATVTKTITIKQQYYLSNTSLYLSKSQSIYK